MIAPAFYWDFGPQSPVTALPAAMICANLDRLEVCVGGEHAATLTPDRAGCPHLPHPPSFADFRAVDGSAFPELRIDGYLGDDRVASRSLSSDPSGDVLALAADDAEIGAGGAGAVLIRSGAGEAGTVTVRTSHPGLGRAEARIRVRRR